MSNCHEVLCIRKSDRADPHERITHIGGRNADGSVWRITQEKAIAGIESGKWTFYVDRGGRIVNVVVAVSPWNHKYLEIESDDKQPDNLLCLPECR